MSVYKRSTLVANFPTSKDDFLIIPSWWPNYYVYAIDLGISADEVVYETYFRLEGSNGSWELFPYIIQSSDVSSLNQQGYGWSAGQVVLIFSGDEIGNFTSQSSAWEAFQETIAGGNYNFIEDESVTPRDLSSSDATLFWYNLTGTTLGFSTESSDKAILQSGGSVAITITYYINYTGSSDTYQQTGSTGNSVTLPGAIFSRDGYTLLGWSKSSSATTATYSLGATATFTSDTSLYAVWQADSSSLPTISISLKSVVFSESDGRTHTLTAYSDKTSAMNDLHTEYWISSSCWLRPITDSDDSEQEFIISLYTSASPNTAITGATNVAKYITGLSDGDIGYEGDLMYFIKDFSGVIEIRIEETSTNAESVAYFGVKIIAGAKLTLRPNYISGTTAGTPNYSLNYIQAKNISSTIPANPFTYDHSLLGWSESSSATPETTPDYDDEATVTLGGDKVLYAVWNQYSNTKNTYPIQLVCTLITGAVSFDIEVSEEDLHSTDDKLLLQFNVEEAIQDLPDIDPGKENVAIVYASNDTEAREIFDNNSGDNRVVAVATDGTFGTFNLYLSDIELYGFDLSEEIYLWIIQKAKEPTSYPKDFYVVRSTDKSFLSGWDIPYSVTDSNIPERIETTATFTDNPEYTRSVVIFYIPSSFTLPLGYIGWDGTSNTYSTDPMLLCLKDNKTFYLLSLDSDGDTRTITSKTITVSSSNYGTSISLLLTRN